MVALVEKNLNYKGRHKTCPYKIHLPLTFGVFCKTPFKKFLFFALKNIPCSKKTTVGATPSRWLPSKKVCPQMVALVKKNLNYKGRHKTCPYKIHLAVLQDAIEKKILFLALKNIPCSKKTTVGATPIVAPDGCPLKKYAPRWLPLLKKI